MYDQIAVAKSLIGEVLEDPNYTPEAAVKEHSVIVNDQADELAVLIPPWHGGGSAYEYLASRYAKAGMQVVSYDFSDFILSPDPEEVVESFTQIQQRVAAELTEMVGTGQFKKVHAFASSLGNVALCMIAEAFPDFTDAYMVVAGSNLALCLWDGIRTQGLRHLYESGKKPITRSKLDELWASLAPMNNISSFKGKPVNLLLSKTDQIIPSQYQFEMAEALESSGSLVTASSSRLGHYLSVGAACYLPNWVKSIILRDYQPS